jgi:hypothetical protein
MMACIGIIILCDGMPEISHRKKYGGYPMQESCLMGINWETLRAPIEPWREMADVAVDGVKTLMPVDVAEPLILLTPFPWAFVE